MFAEYIEARSFIPSSWIYPLLRRFHNSAHAVMVATASLERELGRRGFRQLKRWSRGVDVDQFRPGAKEFLKLPRPIFIYVGRVAVEKNLDAFLRLSLPGSKLVVGDGPQLPELKQRYPSVHFVGPRFGEDLAMHYAASDVFVFPSRTDTFGLVLLEALASGVPVAAYPVQGPLDVVGSASQVGVLDDDLGRACMGALSLKADTCRRHALGFSWEACAQQFLSNLSWRAKAC
jgi:glycosyltransferase involved in cell wall biosynthesis